MLEKYQNFLEKCKKKYKCNDKGLMNWDIQKIENLFNMQDTNKELRFNAINQNQVEMTERYEEHIQTLLENVYVPDYDKVKELAQTAIKY